MSKQEDIQACLDAYEAYSEKYNIQDVIEDAIFDIDIDLPEKPKDPKKIINFGKPKVERKFPKYEESFVKQMDENYHSPDGSIAHREYLEFIKKEWGRRDKGLFFYNGDKLEYITGRHYMMLQYWKAVVTVNGRKRSGAPMFKDVQRDVFYVLKQTREDRSCAGIIFTSSRRMGKTLMAITDAYWDTTENQESRMTIQSKNDDDAKIVFDKIISGWQKLPSFWKPKDTGESTVRRILRFSEGKKKTKGRKEYEEVLNSVMFPTNAKEAALDGDYFSYVFTDEAGKADKKIDVNERHNISRECVMDNGTVVGYCMVTTTVEDMEKYSSDKYQKLWARSNATERNPDGKTDSYLFRLFMPCYYGFQGDEAIDVSFVDEWGYTDHVAAKEFFKTMYEAKAGDLSYRRKYPITIDDAFSLNSAGNSYNQHRLYQQHMYNNELPVNFVTRGNFYWKGGMKDTEVDFAADENGRWLVAWMPPPEDRNRKEQRNGHWYPTRDFCKTGCDPFSHRETVGKGSQGAGTTILRRHYSYPAMEMAVVCHYLHRPQHPHQFAEDMIMQAVFYSSEFLSESNKYGVLDTFNKRGYDGFCLYDPLDPEGIKKRVKGHRGIPMTGTNAREAMMDITQAYINDHMGQHEDGSYGFCPFDDIIQDWRKFEPDSWTVYDSAVSVGMALIATKKVKQVSGVSLEPKDFFQKWNNKGRHSIKL